MINNLSILVYFYLGSNPPCLLTSLSNFTPLPTPFAMIIMHSSTLPFNSLILSLTLSNPVFILPVQLL